MKASFYSQDVIISLCSEFFTENSNISLLLKTSTSQRIKKNDDDLTHFIGLPKLKFNGHSLIKSNSVANHISFFFLFFQMSFLEGLQ